MNNNQGAIIIEGHVQGLSNTRALGEEGIPVYVIDKNDCIAHYSKYCKKFFRCPDYRSPKFVLFLINLAKKEKLNGWLLLPSNDHAVYALSKSKKKLIEYYKLITPEIEIINNIYNKELLLRSADKCEVPAPKSWFPSDYETIITKKISYPCLIKGKFGFSFYKKTGKKAFLAKNKSELNNIINNIQNKINAQDLIIQKLIPYKKNKTISFAAFCENGLIKSRWIGIKLREHPLNFGTATYAKSIANKDIEQLAKKILSELNYTGICEVEFLFDPSDNQYKLIEINARTWLWVELAKKCGINFALLAFQYVNNIPNKYISHYLEQKEWMHYITDIPFSILGSIKGQYSLWSIIRSYLRFPSPAVFRVKDILPFFAEFFIVPLRFLK